MGQVRRGDETLFISDLHLSPQRPILTALFLRFLERRAPLAARLCILGDLFDVWVGDDDDLLPEVRAGLRRLSDGGTDCLLMRGNRDFLLGRGFARHTGCQLISDPHRIWLGDAPVLLMHGDLLCTDDVAYQRFRRRARNPLIQCLFLWLPLARRRRIAAGYRQRSGEAMAAKAAEIMDVNDESVRRQMRRSRVHRLIHGHTHRPGDHRFSLDGRPALRQVLADWQDDRGEILAQRGDGWQREDWH